MQGQAILRADVYCDDDENAVDDDGYDDDHDDGRGRSKPSEPQKK